MSLTVPTPIHMLVHSYSYSCTRWVEPHVATKGGAVLLARAVQAIPPPFAHVPMSPPCSLVCGRLSRVRSLVRARAF